LAVRPTVVKVRALESVGVEDAEHAVRDLVFEADMGVAWDPLGAVVVHGGQQTGKEQGEQQQPTAGPAEKG